MDEKITLHRRELERAMSKKDSRKTLELLRELDNIPMTLDVLISTQIGASVNKARKTDYDTEANEIVSLGRKLVKRWKGQLPASDSNSSSSSNNVQATQVTSSSSTAATATTTSPTEQPTPSTSHSNSADNSRVRAPVQTEIPHTNDSVRLTIRKQLTDALKLKLPDELTQEAFLEEEVLAARVEECIFREFKNSQDSKYRNRCRSRVSNLRDVKNPYLRYNVLRGDIAPERLAKMTADEMASDELKKEREKFTKEAINDHQMALTQGAQSSEIKCPACKKYNCTYNQMQTRSADEPMTTFCHCNECGRRWKFC